MSLLSDRERALRIRLRDDLPWYAPRCLKVRSKSGQIVPFVFNPAQVYLHNELERQRAAAGMVRALVLKGRQEGISTYVAGRFYHRATHHRGQRVYILTHQQEATDNLFGFVTRFHDHAPALVRPATGTSSAKELVFNLLDSGYKVATAGTRGSGRSQTIQLFHASEVAFWPHADEHGAGALQAVPHEPGTEVIKESTANGVGNAFHQDWQLAEAGGSDYVAIFVPWFLMPEYRRPVGPDFALTSDEMDIAEVYGLDFEQVNWRRHKIVEFKGDTTLFMQEYPMTAAEAFQMSGHNAYIPAHMVVRARKMDLRPGGTVVLGVDPARFGNDRFAVAARAGRKIVKLVSTKRKMDNVQGAGFVKEIIDELNPARVFVDVGGQGAGVGDLLRDWYGGDRIRLIDFGGSPIMPPPVDEGGKEKGGGPKNRRAEMWMLSKEWLEDPGGADIPDTDSIQADACGPEYSYDAHQRLVLESKEHMMNVRKVRSPDEWDAVALTFAEPVAPSMMPRTGPGSAAGGDSTAGY